MSRQDNNPSPVLIESQQPGHTRRQAGSALSAQIAHELANLLDGSLRNISLALSGLKDPSAGPSTQADGETDPVARLQVADGALRRMAALLHRWMSQANAPTPVSDNLQTLTLDQAVRQAVRLLGPAADQNRVDIQVSLSDEAAQLPAGPIYPVVVNALRNSIQAINDVPDRSGGLAAESRQIKIEGCVCDGMAVLEIHDDGPGLGQAMLDDHGQFRFGQTTKPDGHGIGLLFCRDVAAGLGGQLTLTNGSPRGAVLTLRFPVESVR